MSCNKDEFCNVCAKHFKPSELRNITQLVANDYREFFNTPILRHADAPGKICHICVAQLSKWRSGKTSSFSIAVPALWNVIQQHRGCFFCNYVSERSRGQGGRYESKETYWNSLHVVMPKTFTDTGRPYPVHSSTSTPRPTRNSGGRPSSSVTQPSTSNQIDVDMNSVRDDSDESSSDDSSDEVSDEDSDEDAADYDFAISYHYQRKMIKEEPLTAAKLEEIVKRLKLPSQKAEGLVSALKKNCGLEPGIKITDYGRNRKDKYIKHFAEHDFDYYDDKKKTTRKIRIAYCSNIVLLMNALGFSDMSEWRLFFDGCNGTVRFCLLSNGSHEKPVILSIYRGPEKYEIFKWIFEKMKLADHRFKVVADFKALWISLGMLQGRANYPCPFCLWPSRDKEGKIHYHVCDFAERTGEIDRKGASQVHEPLFDLSDALPPILHCKLGVVRKFLSSTHNEEMIDHAFKLFRDRVSESKVRKGSFTGPSIDILMANKDYVKLMDSDAQKAWELLIKLKNEFFGQKRARQYRSYVSKLLKEFQDLEITMTLMIHVLDSHLDLMAQFDSCSFASEEQGESFHQFLNLFIDRHKKCTAALLSDIMWHLY